MCHPCATQFVSKLGVAKQRSPSALFSREYQSNVITQICKRLNKECVNEKISFKGEKK